MCKMVWVFCVCGVKIFSKFEECSVQNCEFAETETRTSVTVKCHECRKKLSDGTKKAVSWKNFILSQKLFSGSLSVFEKLAVYRAQSYLNDFRK